jgi:hypothetical protein
MKSEDGEIYFSIFGGRSGDIILTPLNNPLNRGAAEPNNSKTRDGHSDRVFENRTNRRKKMFNPKDVVGEQRQGWVKQINELMKSPAYMDASDKMHLQTVRKVRRFSVAVWGSEAEKDAEVLRTPSPEEAFYGVRKLEI